LRVERRPTDKQQGQDKQQRVAGWLEKYYHDKVDYVEWNMKYF